MTLSKKAEQQVDALVDELRRELGEDAVSVDVSVRESASMDWAHMSPILMERLPATVADVVAFPTSPEGIERAVALAHRHRVPLTPRGKGTGNYGQAVPLEAGLVISTDRCEAIIEVGDGWMRVEPGAKFVLMEQAARASGQELTQMPSTVGSTVGGFVAGGSGGTGSIESGWNHDGFIEQLDVVPCHEDATSITMERERVRPFCHAYGTTGVISGAVVRLAPRRDWTGLFGSFPSMTDAIVAGQQMMTLDPLPRLISVDDPALSGLFTDDPAIPAGRASLRAIIDAGTEQHVREIVSDAGGHVEDVRAKAPAYLTSISFNHVAYRAMKARPELTHLQASGPGLVARTDDVFEAYDETMLHLDGFKLATGPGFISIILTRFEGIDELYAGMDRLADVGVHVNDPHVWHLHRDLELYRPTAAEFDPDGLLNPGKLPKED